MLRRRPDEKSIGVWKYKTVGRPTAETRVEPNHGRAWVQKCNFTFLVSRLVHDLDHNSAYGWGIDLFAKHLEEPIAYVIPCDMASSSTALRQGIMKLAPSIVCRMGSDDFLAFVDQDLRKQDMSTLFVTKFVGKVYLASGEHYWVFPEVTLDENGIPVEQIVILKPNERSARLPTIHVPLLATDDKGKKRLAALSERIRLAYGSKFIHVVHLLTSVLKAIHYDTIMKHEHYVPVANIFGPANTGKTLACAIALQIMQSPELMLSRCTASSMIDTANLIKNMLIVWDDPRDCTASQLSAIVHEAFNGLANCTISRGTRHYHSSLIIGTQQRCLGMTYNAVNVATFSRLSHISMEEDKLSDGERKKKDIKSHGFDPSAEPKLQEIMQDLDSVFPYLLKKSYYDATKVKKIYDKLREQNPLVISRSLATAAIDCHCVQVLRECGFTASTPEVKSYFFVDYPNFLLQVCPRSSPLQQFLKDVKRLLDANCKMPVDCYKDRVMVDFKPGGLTECFAVQPKEFFAFLTAQLPYNVHYTREQVHSELRMCKSDGAVSHNVAFKTKEGGVVVKRSMVIRRALLG